MPAFSFFGRPVGLDRVNAGTVSAPVNFDVMLEPNAAVRAILIQNRGTFVVRRCSDPVSGVPIPVIFIAYYLSAEALGLPRVGSFSAAGIFIEHTGFNPNGIVELILEMHSQVENYCIANGKFIREVSEVKEKFFIPAYGSKGLKELNESFAFNGFERGKICFLTDRIQSGRNKNQLEVVAALQTAITNALNGAECVAFCVQNLPKDEIERNGKGIAIDLISDFCRNVVENEYKENLYRRKVESVLIEKENLDRLISGKDDQILQIESELSTLKNDLVERQSELSAAHAQLITIEAERNEAKSSLEEIKSSLENTKTQLGEKEIEFTNLVNEFTEGRKNNENELEKKINAIGEDCKKIISTLRQTKSDVLTENGINLETRSPEIKIPKERKMHHADNPLPHELEGFKNTLINEIIVAINSQIAISSVKDDTMVQTADLISSINTLIQGQGKIITAINDATIYEVKKVEFDQNFRDLQAAITASITKYSNANDLFESIKQRVDQIDFDAFDKYSDAIFDSCNANNITTNDELKKQFRNTHRVIVFYCSKQFAKLFAQLKNNVTREDTGSDKDHFFADEKSVQFYSEWEKFFRTVTEKEIFATFAQTCENTDVIMMQNNSILEALTRFNEQNSKKISPTKPLSKMKKLSNLLRLSKTNQQHSESGGGGTSTAIVAPVKGKDESSPESVSGDATKAGESESPKNKKFIFAVLFVIPLLWLSWPRITEYASILRNDFVTSKFADGPTTSAAAAKPNASAAASAPTAKPNASTAASAPAAKPNASAAASAPAAKPNASAAASAPAAKPLPLKETDFTELKKQANAGDADAAYKLGHHFGNEPINNYIDAVKWYQKAADNGHAGGLYKVGLYYEKGLGGLSKDNDKALSYYIKSKKLGHSTAAKAYKDLEEKTQKANHK